jgi:uncharacterized protein (TIGR02246 family)
MDEAGRSAQGADEAAIRRIRAAVEDAEKRLDAHAFGRLFTEDVAMLPPGNRIDGATAVEDFHRKLYERFRVLEVDFDIEQVHVLGDLAVETGTYTAKSIQRDGTMAEGGGRYVYTYERQPEGDWKIHRMSWG